MSDMGTKGFAEKFGCSQETVAVLDIVNAFVTLTAKRTAIRRPRL